MIHLSCRFSTKPLLFSQMKSYLCLEERGTPQPLFQNLSGFVYIGILGSSGNRISKAGI